MLSFELTTPVLSLHYLISLLLASQKQWGNALSHNKQAENIYQRNPRFLSPLSIFKIISVASQISRTILWDGLFKSNVPTIQKTHPPSNYLYKKLSLHEWIGHHHLPIH